VSAAVWRAPAKLNLTLEVLSRRPDGYHEIRSVVAKTTLCDELTVGEGRGFTVLADEDYDASAMPLGPNQRNSVETALALMAARQFQLPSDSDAEIERALRVGLQHVSLRLTKRIPAAAGFGGGSSDAAAALLALNAHWGMRLDAPILSSIALRIGSDCPVFLGANTQLMAGRGELLTRLPTAKVSCCIIDPRVNRAQKTALAYRLLQSRSFTSGTQSAALARALDEATPYRVHPDDLFNVFDTIADQAFGDLSQFRRALTQAGATAVHLCGAGPALYGLFDRDADAEFAAQHLNDTGYSALALAAMSE
jgi:4-diphosphocytidyl-2-C-methyl-D-erythritol kinase